MLMRWNPFFNELTKFERDIDKIFNNQSFCPAVDIYEDQDKISVEIEVPGMKSEDVEITINKTTLTVKGKRIIENNTNKKDYWRVERSSGSFTRSFALPSSIETEKIKANYDKGILTIHVPKKPETVPRKIEIKSME